MLLKGKLSQNSCIDILLLSWIKIDIIEAFQGVEATSNMTLKTSDMGIANQRHANRMHGSNLTETQEALEKTVT